jgi:hypothetical protein
LTAEYNAALCSIVLDFESAAFSAREKPVRRREFIKLLPGGSASAFLTAQAGSGAVTPEEFQTDYPKVQAWIQRTLASFEKDAQPIASMRFARLPQYFDHALLGTAKFIPIDRVPTPPLSAMGLGRFAAFEQGEFHGITYLDRYFIKRTVLTEEALHFHELIHVIQWRLLGPERFLSPMRMAWTSSDTRTARLKRWPTMLRLHSDDPLRFSMRRSLSRSS